MVVQSHSTLTIGDVHIRQEAAGRYCLNDLHKAAGGKKRHLPSRWLENQQTQELIAEIVKPLILARTGITVLEQNQPINIVNGGNAPGIYAVKELIYAYAMWISPAFHLVVIRAYDAMMTNNRTVALPQNFDSDLRIILNNTAQAMADAILALVDKYASHATPEPAPNSLTCQHIANCEQRTQPQLLKPTASPLAITSQAPPCADSIFRRTQVQNPITTQLTARPTT